MVLIQHHLETIIHRAQTHMGHSHVKKKLVHMKTCACSEKQRAKRKQMCGIATTVLSVFTSLSYSKEESIPV